MEGLTGFTHLFGKPNTVPPMIPLTANMATTCLVRPIFNRPRGTAGATTPAGRYYGSTEGSAAWYEALQYTTPATCTAPLIKAGHEIEPISSQSALPEDLNGSQHVISPNARAHG